MRQAQRRAVLYALLRPESLVIIGFALVMTALCLARIFWFPNTWWVWLLFGVIGAGAMAWSTLRDTGFVQKVTVKLFYSRLNKERIRLPELKNSVAQALEYHRLLFQAIADRPHAPLADLAMDMDQLVTSIYQVAYMLDSFVANDRIHQYLLGAMQEKIARTAAHNNEYQTLEAFTTAIMPIKNTAETSNEKAQLLEAVCFVVNQTQTQLRDTLINISAVHSKVTNTSSTWHGDWSFVDVAHTSFAIYLQNLQANVVALDDLYTSCTLAAKR